MSMNMLIIIQFIGIFLAYTFITVAIPEIVLRKKLEGKGIAEKFLIGYLTGNFYMINLVLYLELLRIANGVTLYLGIGIPAVLVWARLEGISIKDNAAEGMRQLRKVCEGKLGLKTLFFRCLRFLGKQLGRCGRWLERAVVQKSLHWTLLILILGVLFYVYGRQMLFAYGYAASDIPVHMQWINDMIENHVFSDGVYPFGYHATIFYLHKMFGIDVYVVLRLFFFVQVIYLYLVLTAFLKLCTKSGYLAYGAVFFAIICNWFAKSSYSRLLATLPQEFGMIFILPALYFAFRFFEQKKKNESTRLSLICFGMSFSMTLAIHFYGTIIAGIFCVGIAIAYLWRCIRWSYWNKILVTGILSVVVAILPMGIAYLTGTPLQESLNWALGVMEEGESEKVGEETVQIPQEDEITGDPGGMQASGAETVVPEEGSVETEESGEKEEKRKEENSIRISGVNMKERMAALSEKLDLFSDILAKEIQTFILETDLYGWGYHVVNLIFLEMMAGFFLWLLHKREYGAMLLSVGIGFLLLSMFMAAENLQLPKLMDASRISVYYVYLLPILPVFLCDAVLTVLFWRGRFRIPRQVLSLLLTSIVLFYAMFEVEKKEIAYGSEFVTNEAITCLTNIIREEEDGTWTICSANDETGMSYGHGYHYEIIDFLQKMEYKGEQADIRIPTKTVYFFIEKRPLDYAELYEGSGQYVSAMGAAQYLPRNQGIAMYQGENRWVVMSRMYFWAQEYCKKYTNEMKVYLETDTFVCYKIEQNEYYLYNFAIDYGYNHVKEESGW